MKTEPLRLRWLRDPADHARLQDFLDRDLPGYLIGDQIFVDVTRDEALKLAARNYRCPRDRIDLSHPLKVSL